MSAPLATRNCMTLNRGRSSTGVIAGGAGGVLVEEEGEAGVAPMTTADATKLLFVSTDFFNWSSSFDDTVIVAIFVLAALADAAPSSAGFGSLGGGDRNSLRSLHTKWRTV